MTLGQWDHRLTQAREVPPWMTEKGYWQRYVDIYEAAERLPNGKLRVAYEEDRVEELTEEEIAPELCFAQQRLISLNQE